MIRVLTPTAAVAVSRGSGGPVNEGAAGAAVTTAVAPSQGAVVAPARSEEIRVDRYTERPRGAPRMFLMTLERTPERTAEAVRQLTPLGLRLELVRATDGRSAEAAELPRDARAAHRMQPGETALCMSFWRVCARIVADDLPWALVFEDDVRVRRSEGLLETLALLPEDFHFAHINDSAVPAPVPDPDGGRSAPGPWMAVRHTSYVTVAYCVSNAGAREALAGMAPFRVPLDLWFVENRRGLHLYQLPAERAWFGQSWWRPSTVRENNVPEPIPRVFHRVWVGGAEMPAEYEAYWATWRAHHPGYEFRTWGDAELSAEWPGHAALAAAETPAARSDVARLLILERCGGVYVDTDFECYHAFDELLGAGAVIVPDMHEDVPCNGWLAAAPGNPWIARMAAKAVRRTLEGRPILEAAGPAMVKDVISPARTAWPKALCDPKGKRIATAYGDTGVVIIRPEVMFPYYWTEKRPADPGTAWAAHHWAASWWTAEQWEAHYRAFPELRPERGIL